MPKSKVRDCAVDFRSVRTAAMIGVGLTLLLLTEMVGCKDTSRQGDEANKQKQEIQSADLHPWWELGRDQLQAFVQRELRSANQIHIVVQDAGPMGFQPVSDVRLYDHGALSNLANRFELLGNPDHPDVYTHGRSVTFDVVGKVVLNFSVTGCMLRYGPDGFLDDRTKFAKSHTVEVSPDFVRLLEDIASVSFNCCPSDGGSEE